MVIVGVLYTYQRISVQKGISGGGPYGASTVAGNGIGKLSPGTSLIPSVIRIDMLENLQKTGR